MGGPRRPAWRPASTDLSAVRSVASFFVSRVDTEVDRRLETLAAGAGDGAAGDPGPAGDRGGGPGPAGLPAVRGRASPGRAGRPWRPRGPTCSGPCGPRPRPRTPPTPTSPTSTPSSAPTPSTPCPTRPSPPSSTTAPWPAPSTPIPARRAQSSTASARPASTWPTWPATLEDEGVASFAKSFDELHPDADRQGQRPVGGPLSTDVVDDARTLVARACWRATPRCGRRGTSRPTAWAGWMSPAAWPPRPPTSSRGRRASSSPRSCSSGMGGSSLGPAVLDAVLTATGTPGGPGTTRRRLVVCDTTHPATVAAARPLRRLRPGLVEVRHDPRAQRAARPRLGAAARPARATRPSPTRARRWPRLATERGFRPLLRQPSRHRRPLLGALVLRDGARRPHRLRRRRALRAGPGRRPRGGGRAGHGHGRGCPGRAATR